jgi:uncharacterized protein YoxC
VWQVPPSSTPLTVSQVRVANTGGGTGGSGGPGTQYATLPIAISQVTNLSSNLSSINGSVSSLTTQVNSLAATVASTGSITGLQTTVNNLSTTVGGLSTTVGGLNSTVAALNTTVGTNGTTLTNLSATVNGLSTTVSGNTNSISTLTTSLNGLSSTVSGQATSIGSLSATVGGLGTSVTNLNSSVAALTATVNSLSASGSSAVFVDSEALSGTSDGVNTAFALANSPAPTGSLTLFRNGLLMRNGIDFTLSGANITFAANSTPLAGDLLRAFYRTPGSGPTTTFVDAETPGGTANGTNLTFTLAVAPSPTISLEMFKNGVLLTQGADYTLTGTTITFVNTSVTPQPGDFLTASYRH